MSILSQKLLLIKNSKIDFYAILKKRKKWCVAVVLYLAVILFVHTDAWLYKTPVAKITEIHTQAKSKKKATRGETEPYYKQVITGKVLNGKWKGKTIHLTNEYSYSGVLTEKYSSGDRLLVSVNGNGSALSGSIKGLKRDVYLAALLGALVLLLLLVTKKAGIFTICSITVNAVIYVVGFSLFLAGRDILKICNVMAVAFAVGTLIFLNGFNRRMLSAVFSTLCVLVVIMGIFDAVMSISGPFDYSTMEYLGSIDNPTDIFRAEVMLAGLGAIMDVAVTIAAALGELVRKKPGISFMELFRSGREIGYDIMGTMINVLLFVFGCGLIPTFLIRMNNDVSFLTIVRLNIPTEICRFLIESIGIVLAVPISILIAALIMKCTIRRKRQPERRKI